LIRQHLKRKGLNEWLIRKGLAAIDEDDYLHCIRRLAARELERAKGNVLQRRQHAMRFLLRKGFEAHLIEEVLNDTGYFS
jgi:SOS response regulatory protein OraA/RecX